MNTEAASAITTTASAFDAAVSRFWKLWRTTGAAGHIPKRTATTRA